jgi:hypothetical protein
MNEAEFAMYCQNENNVRQLFDYLCDRIQDHHDEISRLNKELEKSEIEKKSLAEKVIILEERIENKDNALFELVEERDRFKEAFTQQALSAQLEGVSRLESSMKSSKIPDPPVLTNGKEPEFEDWLMWMQDKLAANADHCPTPVLRLAYVKSRCSGRAAEHLRARSRHDARNKYKDAVDVLDHLKTIFQDVNRVLVAKEKFRCLYLKPSDRFQDFLSDFSYYAQESGLAESEWKEELYQRINAEMQLQVMREINDAGVDFQGFATQCTRTANRLEQISLREQASSPDNSVAENQGKEDP